MPTTLIIQAAFSEHYSITYFTESEIFYGKKSRIVTNSAKCEFFFKTVFTIFIYLYLNQIKLIKSNYLLSNSEIFYI